MFTFIFTFLFTYLFTWKMAGGLNLKFGLKFGYEVEFEFNLEGFLKKFLVQMRIRKFAFEISWPLVHAQVIRKRKHYIKTEATLIQNLVGTNPKRPHIFRRTFDLVLAFLYILVLLWDEGIPIEWLRHNGVISLITLRSLIQREALNKRVDWSFSPNLISG